MRRLIVTVLALALLALPSAVSAGGRPFVIPLTGADERPGPGDPDGSGTAWLWVNYGQMEICFSLMVENITLPTTGAHIHRAPVTDPGPVVVPLINPVTGSSSGCAEVSDAALLKDILQNPQDYYVNVHTTPLYAAGAVRGQLSK